ncbi:GNAT family N-acetyltransferase [Pseudarthrobacter defluvii]|uniref:GNAT family N-acetyltransferase n=1 Tax=Micrococcaceae TaxID=1268 RepID=UPI003DA943E4
MTPPVPTGASVRPMFREDWPDVRDIYQAGIDTGQATFDSVAPDWDRFDTSWLPGHRFVAATREDQFFGWAAASAASARPAYSGVVEHFVYIAAAARGMGMGIGKALLETLIKSTESHGIGTIQASVFPENEASLRLHFLHRRTPATHRPDGPRSTERAVA